MTAISSGSLGNLAAAEAAGFPAGLLIPILPASAKPGGNVDFQALKSSANILGKAPFYLHASGWWRGLGGWQAGTSAEIRRESDAAGANAGLILGSPDHGETYLALDVDTDWSEEDLASQQRAEEICEIVIQQTAGNICGGPVWCRVARQRRVVILFRVADHQAGGKLVMGLHDGAVDRGKIEVLALGQQVVIGGTHASNGGTPIRWFLSSHDGQRTNEGRYPVASEIPTLRSRRELEILLELIEGVLTGAGLRVTRTATKAASARPADVSPEDQAPPSVDKLIETLDAAPNPPDLERPEYVQVMRAISGCIRALYQLGRLGPSDQERIRDAALGWAERWEGGAVDPDEELAKWEDDYARNPADTLGWPYLARLAVQWGSQDLDVMEVAALDRAAYQIRVAQSEFEATEEAPPELHDPSSEDAASTKTRSSAGQAAGTALPQAYGAPKPLRPGLVDIQTGQIQIAKAFAEEHRSNLLWIVEEKRWIAFAHPALGWSDPLAASHLSRWTQDYLERYVALRGGEWSESTRVKLTSASTVKAIETLLHGHLEVRLQDINKANYAVQAPGAAYCLRSGRPLTPTEHRDLIETRCLGVAPDESVATPRFDALLSHLATQDPAVVEWLWAYMGYLLVGRPVAHILLILTGPGGDGKGTLGRVLLELFGSYGVTLERSVVTEAGAKKHETALYQTRGKRFWYIDELDKSSKWNEAQLRGMSGGSKITARGMRMDAQTFDAEGSFLITTNFIPDFYQIDEAIARRLRLLRVCSKPSKPNPNLDREILDQEGPGIVARIIREAGAHIARGEKLPATPASMEAEANRFYAEQDAIAIWLEERTVPAPNAKVTRREAYKSYSEFTRERKVTVIRDREFRKKMEEKGIRYVRHGPCYMFYGFEILPEFP